MKHTLVLLTGCMAMLLAACGEAAAPAPTRSAAEIRQTERALLGVPTLEPLPTPIGGFAPTPTAPPGVADLFTIPADDPRAQGSPSAPVTLIEFSDFE
ncbi:MAG: hypothetical protein MI924_06600 [Chloroflexales bacterium]|nr:hypothetical protein [Chloroflexales bacterium]